MARKQTLTYYFSVEGETEKWYLDWLQDQINAASEAKYKVKMRFSPILYPTERS